MQNLDELRKNVAALFPQGYVFRRCKVRAMVDGYSPAYLSNLDGKGIGIKNRFFIGRKCAYPLDSYLEWLETKIK